MTYTLLIKNCGQLLTMKSGGLGIVKNAFVACEDDKIVDFGPMKKLKRKMIGPRTKSVDADGKAVMPGLVDCHTHLIFAGNRSNELEMKLEGRSYLDILKGGGGIYSTVNATRKASHAELLKRALVHLKDMLAYGITTVEIKSGYGLDLKTELKILDVAEEIKKKQSVRVLKTFLGAHAVPRGEKMGKYLKFLVDKVLPKVNVDFVDIFCEKGAFSLRQCRKYLKEAKALGFDLKIHAEQINRLGGARMAAKLGAVSVDHCDQLSARDIRKLSKYNSVVVLLPLVPFYLGENKFADGRAMVDAQLRIAVSTDFNPGSAPSKNIFLAMTIACLKMGLTPEEVLRGVTINAAAALKMENKIGSIEKGKFADVVITQVLDYREIPYWFGENPVSKVFIGGKSVYSLLK